MQFPNSLLILASLSLIVASSQAAVLPAQAAVAVVLLPKRHETAPDTQAKTPIDNFLASLFGLSPVTNEPENLSESSPPRSTRFEEFLRLLSTPKISDVGAPTEPTVPDSSLRHIAPPVQQPIFNPGFADVPLTSSSGTLQNTNNARIQAEINTISNIAPSTETDLSILQEVQQSGSQLPENAKYATSGPSAIRFDEASPSVQSEMETISQISPSTEQDAAILQSLQKSGSALPQNARYATSGPSAIRFTRRSLSHQNV